MNDAWLHTLIPAVAAGAGATAATVLRPGCNVTSAIQHFAAGVVFAAAAAEILPDVMLLHDRPTQDRRASIRPRAAGPRQDSLRPDFR